MYGIDDKEYKIKGSMHAVVNEVLRTDTQSLK